MKRLAFVTRTPRVLPCHLACVPTRDQSLTASAMKDTSVTELTAKVSRLLEKETKHLLTTSRLLSIDGHPRLINFT